MPLMTHNTTRLTSPRLVPPILRVEADMLNGSRYISGNNKDTPFYRQLGQNVAGHGHQHGQRPEGHEIG